MTTTAIFARRAMHQYPPPATPTYLALGTPGSGTDAVDGGNYRITGTTKVKGTPDVPASRRVLLCDQLSGRVVRSQWSVAGTGAYAFERIRMGTFFVASFDHTGVHNAVIASSVIPEAMP